MSTEMQLGGGVWLGAEAFGRIAGISIQAARRALRRAAVGEAWRGATLTVRPVPLTRSSWEVDVASLPEALKEQTQLLPMPPPAAAARSSAGVQRRWTAIAPLVVLPRRSPERQAAIEEVGKTTGCSIRSIRRWIARYEAHGLRGLAYARPSNAGRPRIKISRRFDKAYRQAGYSEALLDEIAGLMRRNLKGLWASRAEHAGGREIERLAAFLLAELCETHSVAIPPDAMKLSRRSVERFAHYRVVNQRRNDRKAFDDAKPRIRRDWTGLAPMERVVADVKHLDILVAREDGSTAWPKIVAFMDAGTARVFVHPVLLEPGEGVRQEHVITAFLAMVSHPAWGFPRGLYLDNGAEFGALSKIDHALQLLNEPGARTLIYARPYNASAKPIESLFARLDRYVFSLLPGYAGPNRMAQKTQTVGRPPAPFDGGWHTFTETIDGLIAEHNQRPIGGQWAGRSPDDWFREKVAAGWSPSIVDLRILDAAFCDRDSRRVDRGVVRINGGRYSHPEVQALPSRTIVDLALPWRRDAMPLCRTRAGDWVYLEPEVPFPARWIEGARESSRRQRRQAAHVTQLAKDAPELDPIAIKLRAAGRALPAPTYSRRPAELDLGSELHDLGRAPQPATLLASNPQTAGERRRAQDRALTERLERKLNGGT
jgi:hypothetical protein